MNGLRLLRSLCREKGETKVIAVRVCKADPGQPRTQNKNLETTPRHSSPGQLIRFSEILTAGRTVLWLTNTVSDLAINSAVAGLPVNNSDGGQDGVAV